jgi:hypothetical protein
LACLEFIAFLRDHPHVTKIVLFQEHANHAILFRVALVADNPAPLT